MSLNQALESLRKAGMLDRDRLAVIEIESLPTLARLALGNKWGPELGQQVEQAIH